LFTLPVSAQKLFVDKATIDIGKTGYEMPATAVFDCINKGRHPLKIESVKPDCECTQVDFPKGEIAAGQKFQIRMTYDARQLGHFNKQAAVVSNAAKKPVYICMTGLVLAEWHDYSKEFPVAMGDLLLDKDELLFENVNKGDTQQMLLRIHNDGTRSYQPSLMHLPSWLMAEMKPERLAAGKSGVMNVMLNSELLHDYGLTQGTVFLSAMPGDTVSAEREISVGAVLLPSFAGITEQQLAQAPRLKLSRESVKMNFNGKKKKTEVIELTNTGQTELNISSLQMFTPGLQISLGKSRLAPGKTTKLKITADSAELKKVRLRPRVLMITNDPVKPKVTITVVP
ncbi:MAG: DUF1573 domain-containing protein, partial [Prevotella sp.]|nr:DUF1573 domain-containing protein [Prevotella sp.]